MCKSQENLLILTCTHLAQIWLNFTYKFFTSFNYKCLYRTLSINMWATAQGSCYHRTNSVAGTSVTTVQPHLCQICSPPSIFVRTFYPCDESMALELPCGCCNIWRHNAIYTSNTFAYWPIKFAAFISFLALVCKMTILIRLIVARMQGFCSQQCNSSGSNMRFVWSKVRVVLFPKKIHWVCKLIGY